MAPRIHARIVLENDQRSAQVEIINNSNKTTVYRISLVNRRMSETGDLSTIDTPAPDELLADSLVRLTATGTIRANILRHDPVYREQIRGVTPWAVQQYIWEHCFRQLGGIRQELIDCPAPISEAASADLLDRLEV